MKNTKVLLIILAVVALSVPGCSKKEDSKEPVETKTETVQPVKEASGMNTIQPAVPSETEKDASGADTTASEAVSQFEQIGEAVIEQGEQALQGKVDEARQQITDEINKKAQDLKAQGAEMVKDIAPSEASSKTMEEMLKEKAESKGIKLP